MQPVLGRDHLLCPALVRALRPAFSHPMGEDALCGGCARERPAWDQARAVLRYDKNSRHLVLGLKHGDRTHIAAAFGQWMHRSRRRRARRRRSPRPGAAALDPALSATLQPGGAARPGGARRRGPEVAADWLVRRRRTPMQGHLGPAARDRNVRGAFAMRARRASPASAW